MVEEKVAINFALWPRTSTRNRMSGGKSPRILKLRTRCKRAFICNSRPLFFRGKRFWNWTDRAGFSLININLILVIKYGPSSLLDYFIGGNISAYLKSALATKWPVVLCVRETNHICNLCICPTVQSSCHFCLHLMFHLVTGVPSIFP